MNCPSESLKLSLGQLLYLLVIELCYNQDMQNFDKNKLQKHSIHRILAHSYIAHLILFLFGVFFDVIFRFKVFTNSALAGIGAAFLILGSILIFWAQYTSHHLNKKNITKETFCQGPYCYTRTPTNFGLFFLVLGFGLAINAFFVILSAFVSLLISRLVFLNKQEKMLAVKYGDPYLEYKKSVKF